ncbi:TetR family transcriptional regulator [Bacteroidia bacterium]|nr:TetR family transcriptional regulator [Bacteroidia bacterium]
MNNIEVKGTKDTLIEVARQLFAKIGIENTTMNDIAVTSNKGRRTLYTYFNCKEDVYLAVVEAELNQIYRSLETVVDKKIPADKKLLEFIFTRFEALKELVLRNGTLRASFFRDIWRLETVRKRLDIHEINYIQSILKEGVNANLFEVEDIESMAFVLHYAFKGLEIPYIQGTLKWSESMLRFLFHGIKKNK